MSLLGAWRAQLAKVDDCPWPGPRPIRVLGADSAALPGRERDAKEIARLIRGHGVVVLTGASGVGKTSALYAAVRPLLRSWEREVMLCDTWNPEEDFDAATLIATQVERDLPLEVRIGEGRPSMVEQLDMYYPDKAVIILDQFEELIRYRPRAYRKVLEWIKETAKSSSVRIVISLRIEYEHELTRELKTTPFTQTRYELLPVSDAQVVGEIISTGGRADDHAGASASAVKALVEAWNQTIDESGWSEIGLLHLQATLYSLWARKAGARVEVSDIDYMSAEATKTDQRATVSRQVKLFEHGLTTSVQVALNKCAEACPKAGVDDAQATRARELVVVMTEHLSSGGYKISLNREELADRVLRGSTRSMVPELANARATLATMVDKAAKVRDPQKLTVESDWLVAPRSTLIGPQVDGNGPNEGQRRRRRNRHRSGRWPWQLDKGDETSGALLGLRQTESAIEELRSFHFALEWLRMCELIRVTSTEPGKTMVSLIHDRFAEGLERWRDAPEQSTGIKQAIARVSAIKGEVLDWSAENDEEPLIIVNARWIACRITRRFAGTTFVNCDFRGSTFVDCEFKGTSFINCVLDDVEFLDCRIIGRPSPLPTQLTEKQKRERPAFQVSAPKWVPVLNRYREAGDVDTTTLFSRTAGLPALPTAIGKKHPQLIPFIDESHDDGLTASGDGLPQPGGLTMFGGRLSSLKFRACEFPRDGWLSLRHVAGSSVELAEQDEARIEVFAAALRGLTVTTAIDALRGDGQQDAHDPRDAPFVLEISDSVVINTWFGARLNGRAKLTNCVVWQVFNASEAFVVELPRSLLLGGVNVDNDSAEAPIDLVPGTIYQLLESVEAASQSIDYRRTAAYDLSLDEDWPPKLW